MPLHVGSVVRLGAATWWLGIPRGARIPRPAYVQVITARPRAIVVMRFANAWSCRSGPSEADFAARATHALSISRQTPAPRCGKSHIDRESGIDCDVQMSGLRGPQPSFAQARCLFGPWKRVWASGEASGRPGALLAFCACVAMRMAATARKSRCYLLAHPWSHLCHRFGQTRTLRLARRADFAALNVHCSQP